MNTKGIIDLFRASLATELEHKQENQATAQLRRAIALFESNPSSAIRTIRQLQEDDPRGFAINAVRTLVEDAPSPATEYLAGIVVNGDLLVEPLFDLSLLSLNSAISLAGEVSPMIPMLDVKLVRRLLDDLPVAEEQTALRTLAIVSAISDGRRLLPHLNRIIRHPSRRVQSKAARLISRIHQSQAIAESLSNQAGDRKDPRILANAMEDIEATAGTAEFLWQSANDPNHRVSTTALAALACGGSCDAIERLLGLTADPRPVYRAAAAWALGRVGTPECEAALRDMVRDAESSVRTMAIRSLVKIRRSIAATEKALASPDPESASAGEVPPQPPFPAAALPLD
ncbi:MAG: HEAT repeat domain-containing protein [Bryobacteraceae bacterium]